MTSETSIRISREGRDILKEVMERHYGPEIAKRMTYDDFVKEVFSDDE